MLRKYNHLLVHIHRVRLLVWCSSPTVFLSHIIPAPASSSSYVIVFFSHNIPIPASSSSLPNAWNFSRTPMSPDTWGSSAAGGRGSHAGLFSSSRMLSPHVHMLGDPNKETKQALKLFSSIVLSEVRTWFTKPDLFSTIKTMNTECQKGHES